MFKNAARMLVRDVDNMRRYFGRFAPELLETEYGLENWSLYARGMLSTGTRPTGRWKKATGTSTQ